MFRAFVLICFCCCAGIAQAQWEYNRDADRTFTAALKKFSLGEYVDAAADFEYITRLPPNQKTTAAYVMLGKSYFNANQFRESVRALKEFIDSFPGSSYLDDAQYTLGLGYEAQQRYDDALVQFLSAMRTTTDARLRARAAHYCETIAQTKLAVQVLTDLHEGAREPDEKDYLAIQIAEKHLTSGNIVLAARILDPVVQRVPPSPYRTSAERLLDKIRTGITVRVGLLLPLMTRSAQKTLKAYGEDFLQGMRFALEDLRPRFSSLVNIELDVRDTERDPVTAARHAQELAEDPSVVAILGPVFNNEALACAAVANAKEVPLVTPTANSDGIAAVGPYVFQLNPDMTTRGRAAARYAVNVLGVRTLGVVAPNDGQGRAMAFAFAGEASQLGARVVAAERYAPGATDLREQLSRVRRVAMIEAEPMISFAEDMSQADILHMVEAGVRPKTIDSLMDRAASISVYALFGPDGKKIADSLRLKTFAPDVDVQNLELPASGIQALFLPINSPEEIVILSSQVAYHNLTTQLLGSHDWYNTVELDASRRYTDGVIFFSDFFVGLGDTAYLGFSRRWSEKAKRRVSTNALLGYDAMALLASAIFDGSTTRQALVQALSAIEGFPAIHAPVTLKPDRVNWYLHVLQYKDGEVRRIGSISVR